MKARSIILMLAALGLATAPARAERKPADIAITDATIVDVEHGRTIPGQMLVIRGEDIVAVGPAATVARDWRAARTISARSRYVIPGLWDMHVHFGGGPELLEENKALLPL